MNATVEADGENKKIISVVIPKEAVQKEFDGVLAGYRKNINIEGFRKGKVPQHIIMKRYGNDIMAEAVNKLISNALVKVYNDNKINPVGEAMIEDLKADIKQASELSFKAIVEIDSEIEIKGYRDLGIKVEEVIVSDEEVDLLVDNLKNQRVELNETDEPIKNGDVVELKYENVIIDGETTDDKVPAPKVIEIGHSPLSELNSELLGLKKGAQKDVSFVLPEDYPMKDYSGKSGSASIEIVNVRTKTLLPLDEEFFAKMGISAKNEEELKAIVKDNVFNKKKNEAKVAATEKVIGELLKQNEFFVPRGRIKYYMETLRRSEEGYYNAKNPQPSIEEYIEKRGDEAANEIRRYRIMNYIADKENIKVSEAEIDAYIEDYAKMYGGNPEELKKSFHELGETNHIRNELRIGKAFDCMLGIRTWEDASK